MTDQEDFKFYDDKYRAILAEISAMPLGEAGRIRTVCMAACINHLAMLTAPETEEALAKIYLVIVDNLIKRQEEFNVFRVEKKAEIIIATARGM